MNEVKLNVNVLFFQIIYTEINKLLKGNDRKNKGKLVEVVKRFHKKIIKIEDKCFPGT